MKKVIKYKSGLSKQEITFTVDEKLNRLKGKVLAPKNWRMLTNFCAS